MSGEQHLGPLCEALQDAVTKASKELGDFIVHYPVARLDLGELLRELSAIQMSARQLGHNATALEDGIATLPTKLSTSLVDVVEKADLLVEDMDDALTHDDPIEDRGNAWLEHTAERLLPMTRMAENLKVAMNLGLDVLLFAINFQPQSNQNGLPAYSDSQILQEALNLRGRLLEEAENDDQRFQDQLPVLVEFVAALQEYMEETNSIPSAPPPLDDTPPAPGTAVSSLHSETIPDYHAIGITNPTPLSINLHHVAKKELSNHEVVEIAFLLRNGQPAIAVSTMDPPTRFYDTQANQVSVLSNQHGVNMLFSENGRTWSYLTEEDPKDLNALSHDGVRFKKPSVYLGDYINGRRIQQMRWPGARPLCFSRDGRRLAVASARNRIALIDVRAGAVLDKARIIACHLDEVTQATFSPDGRVLVTQSRDGTVRATDPETGRSVAKMDADTWKKPLFVGVTPDSAVVVSVWGDTVFHWNYTTGALESYALGSRRTRQGWPLAISRDCRFLCCRTDDGVDISDLYSGKVLYTIKFQSGHVTAATFSHDGRYLVLGKAASWMGVRVTMSTLDIWELRF